MPIPGTMKIADVKGGSKISGREGDIEVLEFHHRVYIPIDKDTGTLMGTRKHEPLTIIKFFDKSSPLLYKALCEGKTFKDVTITWFEIDDEGAEKPYFTHKLETVKVCFVRPYMPNVKIKEFEDCGHMEEIGLRYAKITWSFIDGNITHTDSWNEGR